jgi:hypothetical protein
MAAVRCNPVEITASSSPAVSIPFQRQPSQPCDEHAGGGARPSKCPILDGDEHPGAQAVYYINSV